MSSPTETLFLLQQAQECPSDSNCTAALAAVRTALAKAARQMLLDQPAGHSLSSTELVDDAFRLAIGHMGSIESRAAFHRYATRCMMSIVVQRDGKRRRRRQREQDYARTRGLEAVASGSGEFDVVDLNRQGQGSADETQIDFWMDFEQWLENTEALDEQHRQAVALFRACFEGTYRWALGLNGALEAQRAQPMSVEQAGKQLGLTRATTFRRWDLFQKLLQEHPTLGPCYEHLCGGEQG